MINRIISYVKNYFFTLPFPNCARWLNLRWSRIEMHLRVPIRWPLTFRFFAEGLASHLSVGVPGFRSLWSVVQKNATPRGYPTVSSSSLIAIYALARPEHENNEPALGVAELVDRRGWKDISEREIKGGGEGEARNGRCIVRESSGEASKKKPACWLFRNERLVGLSQSILAHSMSPE